MKRWRAWLGIAVSVLLLWLALRGLEIDRVWDVLREARFSWLAPGILVYFCGVWVRAWRWRLLLRPLSAISTRSLFPIVTIGFMGNNLYPARAGEILRALALRRRHAVPLSASLATILVERVLDGMVMLGFVLFNLSELTQLSSDSSGLGRLHALARWGMVVFSVVLVALMFAALTPRLSRRVASWGTAHLAPRWIRARAEIWSTRFLQGLEALRSPKTALALLLSSIVIWVLETGEYWFVMRAFPFEVSFSALLLLNGIVNLATIVPSAPGYLGTFDASGIAVLTALGVPAALAAGYTLVLHAALWLPVTVVGGWFFARAGFHRGLDSLRAESNQG